MNMPFHRYTLFVLLSVCWQAVQVAMAQEDQPEKYALLVGVTDYAKPELNTGLKFPEKDASDLADFLRASGFEVDVLLGKQATRKAIKAKLDTFSQRGKNEGVIFVGLCGHGTESAETKQSYFCPYDTAMRALRDPDGNAQFNNDGTPKMEFVPDSMLAIDDVLVAFGESQAANRILVADCCRDDPNRARGRSFGSSLTTDKLPIQTLMLLGCSSQQKSLEHDDWKHGALTKCLLDQMQLARNTSRTMGSIADEVIPSVEKLVASMKNSSDKQKPRLLSTGRVDILLGDGKPKPTLEDTLKILAYLEEQGFVDEKITLLPGDRAPKLPPLKFLEGEPVEKFEKGKVYVINTFAYWCNYCTDALPKLHKLQQNYPQVTFMELAIDGEEDAQKLYRLPVSKETAKSDFRKWWNGKVGYRFCVDFSEKEDGSGVGFFNIFGKTWLKASGSDGIPTAFIVDQKGRIAWIGHPRDLHNEHIDSVLNGNWDTNAFRANYELEKAINFCLIPLSSTYSLKEKSETDRADARRSLRQLERVVSETNHVPLLSKIRSVRIGLELYRPSDTAEFLCNVIDSLFEEFASDPNDCVGIGEWLLTNRTLFEKDKKPTERFFQRLRDAISTSKTEPDSNCYVVLAQIAHQLGNRVESESYKAKALELAKDEATKTRIRDFFSKLEKTNE